MAMDREERERRAGSFGSVAEVYERARPGYPEDAVRWLAGPEPCDVVDLAAGTGKLTRSLVALVSSRSECAVLPDEEQRPVLARVGALFDTYATDGVLAMPYVTECFRATRL